MSIFDLPRDDFLAMLPELRQQGVDTDALLRQYRSANSPLEQVSSAIFGTGLNEAATASQDAIADQGRTTSAMGLLSKDAGATGMDAFRSLGFEGINGLLGALSGVGQAADAPMAAAQGLIPQGDMALEALGTAGAAMTGGGAATAPRGSLRANALRGGGMSDPTQTGWTFRDVDKPNFTPEENRRIQSAFDGTRWREAELPIRSMYATQETVNPDFATTASSQDLTPTVVKRGGNYYVRDGHHRLTRAAESGDQTANVAIIDLDGTDTSAPLLDYRAPTPEQIAARRAETDSLYADLFGDMSPEDAANMFSANADTSGGLLATAASDALTPSQQMARRILDMRAAGRAGDVTDDMMAQADPQTMFNETPLPMDAASRAARASEGGFEGGMYHGTGNLDGFDRFDNQFTGQGNDQLGSGFYFTNEPSTANAYTENTLYPGLAKLGGDTSPGVIPSMIRQENPIRLKGTESSINNVDMTAQQAADIMRRSPNIMDVDESGMGNWHDIWSDGGVQDWMIDDVAQNYAGPNIISLENDFFDGKSGDFRAAAADVLGYDGVVQPFDSGEVHKVLWNPQQARSQFARFDPEFAHLSNLSAANASPLGGLLAMPQEQEKKELPFMALLKGLLQ